MRCPMCRIPLDVTAGTQACESCPFYHWTRGCRLQLVRCPGCGYHSLPVEGTVEPEVFLVIEPLAIEDCGKACSLVELIVGAQARLVGFDSLHEHEVQRLMAYGLVPGVHLKVLQRVPAYILRIHETELALEYSLAKAIYVLSDEKQSTRPQPAVSM